MKLKPKRLSILCAFVVCTSISIQAQVTIGAGIPPDPSAVLDLQSNDKLGLLLPRIILTDTLVAAPLKEHVKGMFVYNTKTNSNGKVAEGVYYDDGRRWHFLPPVANDVWKTTGNTGIDTTGYSTGRLKNFIGTIGATSIEPIVFGVSKRGSLTFPAGLIDTRNTSIGYMSLTRTRPSTFPPYNAAFGAYALQYNETGMFNTAIGTESLQNNISGRSNTALGRGALMSNLQSSYNTAIGFTALYSLNKDASTGSSDNVAVGMNAGYDIVTGSQNVFLGTNSGGGMMSGSGNIIIGENATVRIVGGIGSYNVVIGTAVSGSSGTANNEVTIGTNGAVASTYRMFATGWTNASDRRLKHDIKPVGQGLSFVEKLEPSEFVYNTGKGGKALGFIAQDVQQVMNESDMEGYNLVTTMQGDTLGLNYTELIPILTKAIQEQQAIINEEHRVMDKQQQTIDVLLKRMEALEEKINK